MIFILKESMKNFLGNKTNSMSAFWSSTDDANENMTQFYGVYGRVDKEEIEFKFRYVSGNHKIDVDPTVLFDWPLIETRSVIETKVMTSLSHAEFMKDIVEPEPYIESEEEVSVDLYYGPFPNVDYPEDWKDQHTAETYKYGSYANYGYGYNQYSSYGSSYRKKYNKKKNYADYPSYEQGSFFNKDTSYKKQQYGYDYYEYEDSYVPAKALPSSDFKKKEAYNSKTHSIEVQLDTTSTAMEMKNSIDLATNMNESGFIQWLEDYDVLI